MLNRKIRNILAAAAITTSVALIASCNINTDKAGQAFEHLGQNINEAVNGEEETEPVVEETELPAPEEAEEVPDETPAETQP